MRGYRDGDSEVDLFCSEGGDGASTIFLDGSGRSPLSRRGDAAGDGTGSAITRTVGDAWGDGTTLSYPAGDGP